VFLWCLDRSVFENMKITVHLTVILLDNKTWLVDFEEPLKKFFGGNRGK
jgi:chromosome condensin MukBEF MukE localization factor